MKGFTRILIVIFCVFAAMTVSAQVKIDLKKKLNKEANQRANSKTDKAIDKTFDKLEEGVGSLFKKKDKQEKTSTEKTEEAASQQEAPAQQEAAPAPVPQEEPKPQLSWAKYDFVPGTEIIFEDNLDGETNGEFPSKWDLAGGVVENANFDNSNVIMFRKCNINGADGVVPLMKNRQEDYLPEEFTIEFDAYFNKYYGMYRIYFLDTKSQKNLDNTNNISNRAYLRFKQNAADGKNISNSYYPGITNNNDRFTKPGWRHIAVSFNKRALKAYIDDARLLNIPNIEYNPVGLTIGFHNPDGTTSGYIKNIRIAKGAVPLYDKFLTDGKFVTTGIKFDVNKATIKPESMGTINYVVKMMTDHPELNFSVEGHTDSDGDDAMNQKLSEARSKAVMAKMVELGISADRLSSKGWGESKPMAANDTPEAKAQNRRVEFVKF